MSRYFLAIILGLLLSACGQPEQDESSPQSRSDDAAYVDRMAEEHADDSTASSGAVAMGEIPPQPVLAEEIVYGEIEGEALSGYLAYPETAHGGLPGVLLFHEWWGLNDNIRDMAEKLAGQGYVVLALDLYEGQVANSAAEARELMQATLGSSARVNANIARGYKFMEEQIGALSIATMGWCLGGSMSMKAALLFPAELDALVIYYGHVTDVSEAQLASLQMPILGLFGGADRGIPVDGVKRFESTLESLGKDATVVIYEGAGHAFANPTGDNFEAEAAEDAWNRTLKFLDRSLNAAVNRNVLAEDELSTLPAEAPEEDPEADDTGEATDGGN